MNFGGGVTIMAALWGASEVVLGVVTRAKGEAQVRDRGSRAVLWTVILVSLFAGEVIARLPATRVSVRTLPFEITGGVLLVCGLVIRWVAIITLGRFFTSNVAIHPGQQLIRAGIYRFVRHPSYSGLLLAFYGLGFACANWFSLLVIAAPITAAVLYRIHVEEAALCEVFGQEYANYRHSTASLFPGLH